MAVEIAEGEKNKFFNVFQIVGLNILSTFSILFWMKTLDFSWLVSAFCAWVGAGLLTVLLAFVFCWVRERAESAQLYSAREEQMPAVLRVRADSTTIRPEKQH